MSRIARDRLARLGPIISSTSVRTDALLKHTSRLLTTSGGIDSAIGTLLFTATFIHSQLTRVLEKRYEKLALVLASNASKAVLPGETIVASIEVPQSKLSRTCAGLKTMAAVSADVWMFLRLFGLFHIYRWASEFYETQHRDAILKMLVWMQIGSATAFQVLENIAYLASKGVLNGGKWEKRATRWMAISSRFWMGQVVLEGVRLLRVRQLRWNEEFGAEKKDDDGEIKVQSEALRKRWRRDFYGNAGWLPLTLHLSYEDESNSPVPEVWQGLGGLVPSVLGLMDAWKETSL